MVYVRGDDCTAARDFIANELGRDELRDGSAETLAAMLADLPFTRLRDAVIAHLTIAEGLGPLLSNVPDQTLPV